MRRAAIISADAEHSFGSRRERGSALRQLRRSLAALEHRAASQALTRDLRMQRVERRLEQHAARLDEHAAILAEIPSTHEIAAALEQAFRTAVASIDARLAAHEKSLAAVMTDIKQTDRLLEKLLQLLDRLR